jgi:hypothetical protein
MTTLLFMLSDFHDEEMTEREEDDLECRCDDPEVEPLGGNLFRVLAPISLTPFGPFGPGLILGKRNLFLQACGDTCGPISSQPCGRGALPVSNRMC